MRVKKTRGGATTYTFFAQYEEEVTNGVTTAISYYTFGGLRIAVKRGSALYHLHGDHLGSTSLTTLSSATIASRAYYAYGSERAATGDLQTDRTFTGQKSDATGLLYYNARYYDPALGTFISPDSLVPNPASVIDHNRFLYARGNPLKYSDPTGHWALDRAWELEFINEHHRPPTDADRTDRLVSVTLPGSGFDGSWTTADWNFYTRNKPKILTNLAEKAGITLKKDTWDLSNQDEVDNLILLQGGVLEFGYKISTLRGTSVLDGLAHLRNLIGGGVTWYRSKHEPWYCDSGVACAISPTGDRIGFFNKLFDKSLYPQVSPGVPDVAYYESYIRGIAVHELAHMIHFNLNVDVRNMPGWDPDPANRRGLTVYADNLLEYWPEAVTDWVYGSDYRSTDSGRKNITQTQKDFIEGYLKP